MYTEDSHSYARTKVTTWSSTVELAQGCVTGLRDRQHRRGSHDSFHPAVFSAVVEVISVLFQLYPGGDMQFWCGTKLDHEFLQAVVALTETKTPECIGAAAGQASVGRPNRK